MLNDITKGQFYKIMINISTLVFAFTSLVTVFVSVNSWKEEKEMLRPYLTFSDSPSVLQDEKELIFHFSIVNVGEHPSNALEVRATLLEDDPDLTFFYQDRVRRVNDISYNESGVITLRFLHGKQQSLFINKLFYLVINLQYQDPILVKDYQQIYYLKWYGINDGEPSAIFHASAEEKERISKYINKIL